MTPLLVPLLLGSACIMDDSASDEQLATENQIIPTSNGDLTLLGNYNELTDTATDTTCVQYASGQQSARAVEPSRNLTIDLVRKKEELAQKLGVGVAGGRSFGIVGASASTDILNEFSSASTSVTYLLTAQADYVVRDAAGNGRDIVMTSQGKQALAQGPAAFARACGTHYVKAVRLGARLHLLITLHATSHESHTQMVSSLGLDASVAGTAEIKNRIEKTSKIEGVNISVRAASSGYWLDQQGWEAARTALENDSIDKALQAAAQLYETLSKAVEKQYCLDSGQGTCGGQPSPGYFARTQRDTAVTGMQLSGYQSLTDGAGQATLDKINKRIEKTNAFLQAYSVVDSKLDAIYHKEIRPFLEAEPTVKAKYNVAPPGTPRRTPDEVYQVAKTVEAKVLPRSGSNMGELRRVIDQRVRACIDTVKGDITKSCTAGDQYAGSGSPPGGELAAESTKQYAELTAYLDQHAKTSSILPMSYRYAGDAVVYGKAQALCDDYADELNYALEQQGTDTRVSYRVPTKSEAALLAPLIGYGAIDWSGADFANTIWYGPQNDCGANYPYFQNQPTASGATTGCMVDDYWDDDLAVVCVPANGPVPTLDAQ